MSMTRTKTVGVIGGLGPQATLDFYGKLIRRTGASCDQEHLQVFIHGNPEVPDRQTSIDGSGPSCVPALVRSARSLERAGADFLVLVCNTAHAYEGVIRAATNIPFLSIIKTSAAACRGTLAGPGRVGLLASDGCLAANLYQQELSEWGMEFVTPAATDQALLMHLIYDIKAGRQGTAVGRQMADIATGLISRGADMILAACTEIPLVLPAAGLPRPLVNSTDALVDATIAYARDAAQPAAERARANENRRPTPPRTAVRAYAEQIQAAD